MTDTTTIVRTDAVPTEAACDLACETLFRWLSAALRDPRLPEARLTLEPASLELACEAADFLREERAGPAFQLGFGELPAEQLSLRPVQRLLHAGDVDLVREYDRVFGLAACRECPPYETEFQPVDEPFFRAQQLADIAGFYRAFGLSPSHALHDRPDHIALELEFVALLLLKQRELKKSALPRAEEHAQTCYQALASFYRDHLAWWAPAFAVALQCKAEYGFYAAVGRMLAALLPFMRKRLGIAAPRMPLQARLCDPSEEGEGCLVELGPARS